MLEIKFLIQLFIILFSIVGAYLVANTAHITTRDKRNELFRARAFLNQSFLNDSWKLLYLACFIFLVNASIEINRMLGLVINEGNMDILKEVLLLAVLVCTVISEYKWFKLMHPTKKT